MLTENTNKYKQILVDIVNYNTLKELGKTGNSFNNVIHNLLKKIDNGSQISSIENADDSLIQIGPNKNSFILKIDSGLRKVQVNQITCHKDYLEIDFLDESSVNVGYPSDLLNIPYTVESALLNSDMRLPNYAVKRIVEYFHEHLYKIEVCIKVIAGIGDISL